MDEATAEEIAELAFVKAAIEADVLRLLSAPPKPEPTRPLVVSVPIVPGGYLDVAKAIVRPMTAIETDQHEMLVDAVLGRTPPLSMIAELQDRALGRYTGGFVDGWDWAASALRKLSADDLTVLYQRLRSTS